MILQEFLLSMGWTLLMIAAKEGSSPDVISEIARSADINAANRDGATAIHFASFGGHTETVRALMEARASVQIKNKVTDLQSCSANPEQAHEIRNDWLTIQAKETALQIASRRGFDATP